MRKSEALKLRHYIETAVQSLPGSEALETVTLHPEWAAGVDYSAGYKTQYGGKLWRCRQAHTSQPGQEPSTATAALWTEVCETHDGTQYNPIPYDGNMALSAGLYYIQDYVIYLCIRDTVNPVYSALGDLVGLYVEVVE